MQARLQAKDVSIEKLKKHITNLKGKNVVESVEIVKSTNVIPLKVYRLDLPPLSPRLKNNREAHVDYLKVTQEHTHTLRDIVDHARTIHPLDNELNYACQYVQRIQELLVSNTRNNRISQTSRSNQNKNKVEDHHRISKSSLNKKNHVSTSVCNEFVKQFVLNTNSELVCVTCKKCMFDDVHDSCVVEFLNNVNTNGKSKSVKAKSGRRNKKECKPTRKVFSSVGHRWLPTGGDFTIVGNAYPLTRITSTKVVPPKKNVPPKPYINVPNPEVKVFHRSTKVAKVVRFKDTPIILGPKISNIKAPNQTWGSKSAISPSSSHVRFRSSKLSSGTVRFGNDQIAKIMGYGDYQLGNVTISRVYYVKGLRHNLFSVGQFCDSDVEVAFRKHTCFVRNLEGVDLISGSRGINLYTISLDDMLKSSSIYLLSKDSKTKSWLWHRRFSQLNFGTLNPLAKQGLARDPREAVEEVAPMTLEGVNARVTELTAVQEQDTQDIYAVIGDTQDRQTQIYQSVETLVDDSQYHYETARLLDQEALVSREAWGRSIEVSYMTRSEIMALRSVVMGQQAVISQLQAADRRSQVVTSEMLQANHQRQVQLTKALKLLKGLQT
ncbi:hypothetical protein Tco_0638085 [Tanacetum coccineum]